MSVVYIRDDADDRPAKWYHETMENADKHTAYAYVWFSDKHVAYLLKNNDAYRTMKKPSGLCSNRMSSTTDSSLEAPSTLDGLSDSESGQSSDMSWNVSYLALDEAGQSVVKSDLDFDLDGFDIVDLAKLSEFHDMDSSFEIISRSGSVQDVQCVQDVQDVKYDSTINGGSHDPTSSQFKEIVSRTHGVKGSSDITT